MANIDLVTFDEIIFARVFLLLFLAGKLYIKPRGFGNIILELVLVEPCLAETNRKKVDVIEKAKFYEL